MSWRVRLTDETWWMSYCWWIKTGENTIKMLLILHTRGCYLIGQPASKCVPVTNNYIILPLLCILYIPSKKYPFVHHNCNRVDSIIPSVFRIYHMLFSEPSVYDLCHPWTNHLYGRYTHRATHRAWRGNGFIFARSERLVHVNSWILARNERDRKKENLKDFVRQFKLSP